MAAPYAFSYLVTLIASSSALASAGRRSASLPRLCPSLPDDILPEIASYLSFRDILSLSLVSKHIHTVVPPRITTLICRYEEHIILLYAYVFDARGGAAVGADRASRLRSLTLAESAHVTRHPRAETCRDLAKPEALVTMFMKVAYAARNLKYLRIDEFFICNSAEALQCTGDRLRSLVHLHLNDLTYDLVEGGNFFSPTLRVLHLSRFYDDVAPVSAFAVLSSIEHSHLRSLTTLVIEDFVFRDLYTAEDVEEWEWSENGPLVAIRELSLIKVNLQTTISHLARSFPNLRSLCVAEHGFPEDDSDSEEDEGDVCAAPAPRLHSLTVVDPTSAALFIPWTCHRLFYVSTKPAQALDLDVCDKTELVGLTLRVFEMCSDVWDAVTEKLPSISWLELEILHTDFASALEYIIRSVSSRDPLDEIKCLSVLAPRSEWGGDTGADVIKWFLDEVTLCFPELRYVALAERDEVSADWKEDYSGDHAPWRWWEVRRDEAGSLVEVLEIPSWRGERIRTYLRDADVQAMDKFDELFAPEHARVA